MERPGIGEEKNMTILKQAAFKSYEWINEPVIGENMFREYDLRNPQVPLRKGGKEIPAAINSDGMCALGKAYGTHVQSALHQQRIVVGCDYRSYSRGNAYAFITGVLSTGVSVMDIGVVITPILYFSQHHFSIPGGAMITSSHNDNGWTGVKLAKGLSETFGPKDILAFKKLVYSEKFPAGSGSYERKDHVEEPYYQFIQQAVKPFKGKRKLKIVVSGAHGGGGYFLPTLIKKLGHETIPFECDLDWDFPSYNPNPENVAFMDALGASVRKEHADLGIAIDGDGDRFGVVNEKGQPIFADRAGLAIARFLVQRYPPGQKIVIDVKSTGAYGRDPLLSQQKAEVILCETGHSYVKAAAARTGAFLGFEKSGHFFFRDKLGLGYDDGCMSAAWFATMASHAQQTVSALIAEQPKSYQSPTLQPSTKDDAVKYKIVEDVTQVLEKKMSKKEPFAGKKIVDLITINGVRVVLEDGSWGLIRASSNQPVLVITAESFTTRKQMYDLIESLQSTLSRFEDVGEYDQHLPPYPGEDRP